MVPLRADFIAISPNDGVLSYRIGITDFSGNVALHAICAPSGPVAKRPAMKMRHLESKKSPHMTAKMNQRNRRPRPCRTTRSMALRQVSLSLSLSSTRCVLAEFNSLLHYRLGRRSACTRTRSLSIPFPVNHLLLRVYPSFPGVLPQLEMKRPVFRLILPDRRQGYETRAPEFYRSVEGGPASPPPGGERAGIASVRGSGRASRSVLSATEAVFRERRCCV